MFPLGHFGISVGIIYIMYSYLSRERVMDGSGKVPLDPVDFRFVLVAAMLPDIIDKVVGMVIFKEELSNGRIFTHSLFVTGTIGLYVVAGFRVKGSRTIQAAFYILPVWFHLVLDMMWKTPRTLLWPALGMDFPRVDVQFSDYFTFLFTEPYTLAGEIVGAVIIIALIVRLRLYTPSNMAAFFGKGWLGGPKSPKTRY